MWKETIDSRRGSSLLESDALHADYLLGNQLDRFEKKLRTAEACKVSEANETATSVQTAAVNKVTATMDPMTAGNQSTALAQYTASTRSATSVRNSSLEEEGK